MTKVNLMAIHISGIKCDNPKCDYRDDSVNRDNYPEYVDKPCPECGSNLLTKEDYEAVISLESIEGLDIDIPGHILDDDEEITFDVEMNGTGKTNLVERKEE